MQPLLVRRRVGHIGQQVGPHAGIVEQRVALGSGAVAGHAAAGALAVDQEVQQIVLDALGTRLQAGMERRLADTGAALHAPAARATLGKTGR